MTFHPSPPSASSLLASLLLAALAPALSAQSGKTFNGFYVPGTGGGEVSLGYSSIFGTPPKSSYGLPPGSLQQGTILTSFVEQDMALGYLSSRNVMTIPSAGELPKTVHLTLTENVTNFSGSHGSWADTADQYVFSCSGAGPLYYRVDWSSQYINTSGTKGWLYGYIYDSNAPPQWANLVDWMDPQPTLASKQGSFSGLSWNGSSMQLEILSDLLQGAGWMTAGTGQLVIEIDITFSSCPTPAADSAYGSGKAGTSGVPVLAGGQLPKLGQPVSLQLTNALPGAVPFLAFGSASLSLPIDGGTLLVLPISIASVGSAVGGGGTLTIPQGTIPPDGSLCGATLYYQAAMIDPGASGVLHLSMTNGLARTIGG